MRRAEVSARSPSEKTTCCFTGPLPLEYTSSSSLPTFGPPKRASSRTAATRTVSDATFATSTTVDWAWGLRDCARMKTARRAAPGLSASSAMLRSIGMTLGASVGISRPSA